MPMHATLKVATKGKGAIKGPTLIVGREGEITINAVRHEVASDVEPKTGLPTADRTHGMFVVTKNIDFTSPHLHDAHKDNDVFTTFALRFIHMPRSGPETDYLAVTLTGARIASYETIMPHVALRTSQGVHEYEEIAFTYESIAWEMKKHQSDASHGANVGRSSEVEAVFAPDWVEEQAKAAVLEKAGALKDKLKAKLWEEWKAANPGQLPE